MCKHTLSARSNAGTSHLKRHQISCRLAYNPDDSVYNWDYKPNVAISELCRLIARLDLLLGIGETEA
jgi:hypothetical protein